MHVKKRTKKLRKLLLLIADQVNIEIFLAFPRKRFSPKEHFLLAKLKSMIALLASGKLVMLFSFNVGVHKNNIYTESKLHTYFVVL